MKGGQEMSEDAAPLRCDGPGCTVVAPRPPTNWITLCWRWPNMADAAYEARFCSLDCLEAKVRVWRNGQADAGGRHETQALLDGAERVRTSIYGLLAEVDLLVLRLEQDRPPVPPARLEWGGA